MAFQRQEHQLEDWEVELIRYRIHSGWSPSDVSKAMEVPLTTIRRVINPVQRRAKRSQDAPVESKSKAHEIAASLGMDIEKD
ncbi:MAG: hypothetical protein HKN29_16485 [Rhodothermales bacterium]|nr:hypothetical protein [Rhodothermales bacterium]